MTYKIQLNLENNNPESESSDPIEIRMPFIPRIGDRIDLEFIKCNDYYWNEKFQFDTFVDFYKSINEKQFDYCSEVNDVTYFLGDKEWIIIIYANLTYS
tara:strand:- start:495 stop:791 length:297 start_codon:yes stop_codon:yes gene_type:complete